MSNADHLPVKARMGGCVREREGVQTFEDATNQAMYKKVIAILTLGHACLGHKGEKCISNLLIE